MPDFVVDYQNLLYIKMQHEYIMFFDELLQSTPEVVEQRNFEKLTKEDIVATAETADLTRKQAKALFNKEHPLEDVYQSHINAPLRYRRTIEDTLVNEANAALQLSEPILPNQVACDIPALDMGMQGG